MHLRTALRNFLVGALLSGVSALASAIPVLQLGIAGGTYNAATQTIVSSGPSFQLYAFLLANSSNTISDTYYLSMALTPQISSSANLGSFTVNGDTVNATSDMTYGIPPLDALFSGRDAGDLATHSVYPTYYRQLGFNFNSANQSGAFNTMDNPSWGPQSGSGMYYQLFTINTSNLANGYAIHFDLYNTGLCINGVGQCNGAGDIDITQFAPFSHDAESVTVPEPGTLVLMSLGLIGIGLARRKRLTK